MAERNHLYDEREVRFVGVNLGDLRLYTTNICLILSPALSPLVSTT